jgi:hypothetical protein
VKASSRPHDRERIAAEAVHRRFDDGERCRRRDRGVHGIPAGEEHA